MSSRAIVVGATEGLGRALCDELAAKGYDLVIASRTAADLDRVAGELRSTHPNVRVSPLVLDIAGPDTELRSFVRDVTAVGNPALILVVAGAVSDNDDGLGDWDLTERLVRTNMVGAMQLGGSFASLFEHQGRGTLVFFSSIAAGAPRGRNVAYAAAKSGLESYARSLQHRFAGSDVAVQLYRLGYLDTRLAEGRTVLFPPSDPRRVARRVIAGLDGGSRAAFEPRYWGAVVRILGILPKFIYNRLRF